MEVVLSTKPGAVSPVAKGRVAACSAPELSAAEQARADRLELSKAALEILDEKLNVAGAKEKKPAGQSIHDMIAESREQAEAASEGAKVMSRCLRIALSIMAGDRVPIEDEHYLQENEPEMYMRAILMRRMKEDPEDKDSVLEDEEDKDSAAETGDVGATPGPAPAAPAPAPEAPAEGAGE